MRTPGRFARRAVLVGFGLALCWAGFHAWHEPDFLLTPVRGRAPLAPLYAAFAPRFHWLGLCALAVLAVGVWWAGRVEPRRTAHFLALALLFALTLRLSVHALRAGALPGPELATYAGEAVLYDVPRVGSASAFLGAYAELQPELSLHGRTKPPGFALLLAGLVGAVGTDLRVLGTLLTLFASALVVPAFFLGRALWGEAGGRATALLTAALPSGVLYGAIALDALFAVVAVAAAALTACELRRQRAVQRIALGLFLCAAAMLSYSAAFAALLCGLLLALRPEVSPARRVRHLAEVSLAAVAPLLALWLATGFDPIGTLANARRLNAEAMGAITGLRLSSPDVWLYASIGNLLAFLIFLGPGLLAALSLLRPGDLGPAGRRFAAALGLTLAAAVAGGAYHLETGRILLFLMALAAALAVRARELELRTALLLLGAQSIAFEIALDTLW